MALKSKLNEIRQSCIDLAIEETKAVQCPFCRAKHENKCYVTRLRQGLVYKCHRASCGAEGFISSIPSELHYHQEPKKKPRHYTGLSNPIPDIVGSFIHHIYGISTNQQSLLDWKYDPMTGSLVIPVLDHRGYQWGTSVKSLPRSITKVEPSKLKVVLYPSNLVHRMHFPKLYSPNTGGIILVEDVISADRLALEGYNAVSVLGTSVSEEDMNHIASLHDQIYVWLDPDATNKAIALVTKYALLFTKSSVFTSSNDPKDITKEEIRTVLDGKENIKLPV
jgi:hypothetical protein